MIERWKQPGAHAQPDAAAGQSPAAEEQAQVAEAASAAAAVAKPVHATALHSEAAAEAAETPATETAATTTAAAETIAEKPAKPKHAKRSWGGRVAWLLAMVVVGIFLGLVIIVCLKFIDGPVTTTTGTTLAQLKASPAASPTMNMLDGLDIELKYPGIFDQMGRSKGGVNTQEAYILSSHSSYNRQIAVDVSKLPSNKLEDDSSYKFRSLNTSEYAPVPIAVGAETATVMVKHDKTERTLFLAHKGLLLTISETTNDPAKDDLEAYLNQIVPTVKWRQ